MKENDIVIVSAVRTPIGKYLGALSDTPAHELGALVLNESLKTAGIEAGQVDDVILGQSYQNGESVNIARMSLLAAGWPVEITGVTLDRRCCSGLDAICFGAMKILSGYAEIIVAGGVESMSRAELYIPGELIKKGLGGKNDPKFGFMPKGHGALPMWGIPLFDRIQRARVMSQPIDRFGELNSMMSWAEMAAQKEGISRDEADRWAQRSQEKAAQAIESGKFRFEIVPVTVTDKNGGKKVIAHDETPRFESTFEDLSKLKAIYPGGVCTAGNSSTENDGAAAVVLMSSDRAKELGINPLGHFVSFGVAGADPTLTYPSVPYAVNKALHKAGLSIKQMDLIEIQEAFAVQVLADAKLMGLNSDDLDKKVNVNGSGISLGHPIAATGTMRLVTLLHEMKRRGSLYGLETICGGGGQGIAAIVRNTKTEVD